MAQSRNFVVTDTETTGLDPKVNEVVEIAAEALNSWDLEPHHAGKFHIYIKPQRPEVAQADAIKLIGDVWGKAQTEGVHPKVAWQKYAEWVNSVNDEKNVFNRPFMVGHNVPFDKAFIEESMLANKIVKDSSEFPWHFNTIDTMTFYFGLFESDPNVKNFRLDSLLRSLGIARKTGNHNAAEDVELTTIAFKRMMLFFREARKRMAVRGAK